MISSFSFRTGEELKVSRDTIYSPNHEALFNGATGTIKLGKMLSDEGGEGEIHCIQSIKTDEFEEDCSKHFVAKLYRDSDIANGKKEKILKMLDMLNNFVDDEALNNVCWPYYAIYRKSQFIGFVMPKATGKTLANLFYPDILSEFNGYSRNKLIDICLTIISSAFSYALFGWLIITPSESTKKA